MIYDKKRQRSASRFERIEGETAPTTSMPPSKKAPLLAPLARRRTQLMENGVTQPRRKIAPRLPAGSSVLAGVPKGREFIRDTEGLPVPVGAYPWDLYQYEFGYSHTHSTSPWAL